jgi:secreted PhoX family phosphatase
MDDGLSVPDYFDGMGCFALGGSRVALVRNHELQIHQLELGALRGGNSARPRTYDSTAGGAPLPPTYE